jgi:hypothetical protein
MLTVPPAPSAQLAGGTKLKYPMNWSVGGASIAALPTYRPWRAQLVIAPSAIDDTDNSMRALRTYGNHRFMIAPWLTDP